jgi:hypothetical protein
MSPTQRSASASPRAGSLAVLPGRPRTWSHYKWVTGVSGVAIERMEGMVLLTRPRFRQTVTWMTRSRFSFSGFVLLAWIQKGSEATGFLPDSASARAQSSSSTSWRGLTADARPRPRRLQGWPSWPPRGHGRYKPPAFGCHCRSMAGRCYRSLSWCF